MNTQKFNDGWLFWLEKNAFALIWDVSRDAREVMLPHDAMLEQKAHPDSVGAGNTGFRDGGVYHYVKEFTPAIEDKEKTFILKFEGVYMNAMVYVNAEYVTKCAYGYTGFYVKLNDYLKYGQKNEIRVIVRNNGMPNSRWYSGGGIYRDVYLFTGDKTYLKPDGFRITTENIDDGCAVVNTAATVVNRAINFRNLFMEKQILDATGKVVSQEKVPIVVYEGQEAVFENRYLIEDAKLWTAETPDLYTLVTRLYDGDTVIEESSERFGIRTLSLDVKRGFRVNGKQVKLRGACIHHDNGIIGAVELYESEHRKIRKLKEEGFNAIRMSHHPASPTLLRVCDELGMYVMDEAFDMWTRCKTDNDYALWFEDCWEQDVEAMVRKDYNHPSVIMYSVGNEISEIGTNHGADMCRRIDAKIKSIDRTRYTLASINGIFSVGDMVPQIVAEVLGEKAAEAGEEFDGNVNDFMASMFGNMDRILKHKEMNRRLAIACAGVDIGGYNYMAPRYEYDKEAFPNRIIVGSETYPSAIAPNWKLVKANNHVLGDFTWTGWDYLGESGIGVVTYKEGASDDGFGTPFPCQIAYTGDHDITGFRRPASYLKEIVFGFRKAPYICVQRPQYYGRNAHQTPWSLTDSIESWSFPEYEGKPIRVEVYSPGDEVELFINGKSVGRKPAGEAVDYRVFFETTYEAGKIQAISYENGESMGYFELNSADSESQICAEIEAEKFNYLDEVTDTIKYINLKHTDQKGTVVTEDDILLEISMEGDGELYCGSGNHSPLYDFREGRTMTFDGRAQVVVRKEASSSNVKVNIKSKYGEQTISI